MNQHFQDSIDLYVNEGIPPGHFLTACFANDLAEAVKRADLEARRELHEIVHAIDKTPGECRGSAEKVASWIQNKAFRREARNENP